MKERNINFLEKYKTVDKLIKDAFGTKDGVTEYIRLMESKNSIGIKKVPSWKDDYFKLKHARWVRNQLAHEASIDSDICKKEDYDWLCGFCNRLLKGQDALALLSNKTKKSMSVKHKDRKRSAIWFIAVAIVIIAVFLLLRIS